MKRIINTYIRFAGMKRHGNHGVINWLISQYSGRICFRNNAGKVTNMINTVCDSIEALLSPERDAADLEFSGDKELFLVSFEDKKIDRVFDADLREQQENWIKHEILNQFRVVLLRDPYNYFASRLQGERNGGFRGELRFSIAEDVEKLLALWKEYACGFLRFENSGDPEEIAISYNHWVMYPDYREEICAKFGIRLVDADAHTVVTGWGNGSSFDGRKFQNAETYMSRWERFSNEPAFKMLLWDKEIHELSDEIFGDTISSDHVRSNRR